MNIIEKSIAAVSPAWAWRRARYRQALAAYEAAKPSRLRKSRPDNASGDALVGVSGAALRGYARQLEQNYDIAEGILKVLINNTIGPTGINREPMPRDLNGDIHADFARALLTEWNDWILQPEVTGELDYAAMERLAARTWFRDGEILVQLLEGRIASLDHGTRVPLSLELIEADHMPLDYDDIARGITQGVERNAWGRPRAYHLYKTHPGDALYRFDYQTKAVSADRMLHPKVANRVKQARGVSIFAAVLTRLEDLKDYEESERIAARIAAALTGYIKKGLPESYTAPETGKTDREFKMKPGMIFDGLQEGEEVGTIDSNRPSSLLAPFHDAMIRFTSAGVGTSYSSTSKNYNGTYSAQRQELVEGWGNYQAITALWVGQFSRPVWRRFVNMAVASGRVRPPLDLDINTVYDAEYRGPAMPWIDPVKEATAQKTLERAGYKSAPQIIRERNGNPDDVMDQIARWRQRAADKSLVFDSDAAHDKATAPEMTDDTDDENDDDNAEQRQQERELTQAVIDALK
jgi:lambda family phage portal protein